MATIDGQRQELIDRLTPMVAGLGFDVDDLSVNRVGRRMHVRVTIDSDDGVGVDDIARVSRTLDEALDAHDPFASPFVLEVSSPGVDRPLTTVKHWQRNVGRLVRVDVNGTALTGRVVSADGRSVSLDVDGSVTAHAWAALGPGRVQIEFNRVPAEAPSAPRATAKKER
jgi:ribosome maturation factor RimP